MNVSKLVRPDDQHRTRFHTARGTLMPLRSWATIPFSVWDRLRKHRREEPWMNRRAVRFLDGLVEQTWQVFELGSGYSTLWLSERCAAVTSLEDDPAWIERLSELVTTRGLHNCILRLEPLASFPEAISDRSDGELDLVIVDCNDTHVEARLRCLEAARGKVRGGGYLLLDDSDRTRYRPADVLLAGWQVRRFVGWKPFPLHAVETSIYRRPWIR